MLTELTVRNFALIDELVLRLKPGYTVLTGETGAGKSIIVDALDAALGEKVSSEVIRGGTDTSTKFTKPHNGNFLISEFFKIK